MTAIIGEPVNRLDGHPKVTGSARYSAEIALPDLAHAAIVGATIAKGRLIGICLAAARDTPGVIAVFTANDLPRIKASPKLMPSLAGGPAHGQSFFPMQDDRIHYAGQPIAVVVAESYDAAHHAAALVAGSYDEEAPLVSVAAGRDQAYEPKAIFAGFVPAREERGDVEAALAAARIRIDRTWSYAANHHNPIEPSATTAVWDGDRLTLYDATQGINATRHSVAELLGMGWAKARMSAGIMLPAPAADAVQELMQPDVRVIADYVGGGFGCKAMIWPHVTLAAMAAKLVGRPVRLQLSRPQMFTSVGLREENEQRISVGADADGKLLAISHEKLSLTSPFDDWAEPALGVAMQAYACPNYRGVYRLIAGNTMSPTFTRGPGETAGMVALECTMDELAYQLGVDPIALRLRNFAEERPDCGEPWPSNGLRDCYAKGAEMIGWADRDPTPRSRRDGNWLIGVGMAMAGYPVYQPNQAQHARARLTADGEATLEIGTQDFGTGAATVLTQVAAEALGVSLARMRLVYGDSNLPEVSAAVGSAGSGMTSAAVHVAARKLRDQLVTLATSDPASPLHGADDVVVADGVMHSGEFEESFSEVLRRQGKSDVSADGRWSPGKGGNGSMPFGMSFGAQFAEVAVDADLGLVRVRRMAGAFACGRILNRRLAHSQLMGGMLWGMGQALLEGTEMDARHGRWANASLGDYLVAVNADAPDVDIAFIDVDDPNVNPLGVKGVGEIGMVGAAAAICNAIFHATGRRVHQLPVRIEHLL